MSAPTTSALPVTSPSRPSDIGNIPSTSQAVHAVGPSDVTHPLASAPPADMLSIQPIDAVEEERRSADNPAAPTEPKVHLRALVISGQSHMFSFEPELTVGRVKELIWSMWPSEWTSPAQPPSPAFLRVLYAGRILQDDTTLASNNMPVALTSKAPTVVHISVRSFSIRAEDDPKKANLHTTTSRTGRQETDDVGGCKCVIM